MLRRLSVLAPLLLIVACGGGRTDDGTDAGDPVTSDGGGHTDGGGSDGGHVTTDGGHDDTDGGHQQVDDGGTPLPDAGTTISVDMFEIRGTIKTGQAFPATVDLQLLTPFVTVQPNGRTHAYDDRQEGIGCYADHYDVGASTPDDADDGIINITGYHGGTLLTTTFPMPTAANKIVCQRFSGNYVCSFDPFSASKPVATQPFKDGQNPLGTGTVTISNGSTGGFARFSVSGSTTKSLIASGLDSLHFNGSQNVTISYSCSGGCTNSLVLVSLGASRNTGTGVPGASASYGAATCAAAAGSSITIPKEAIAAMLGGDTTLRSVFTSIVVADAPANPLSDSAGNPVNLLIGRGVFGISTL